MNVVGYIIENLRYLWEHFKTHDLKSTLKAFGKLIIYVLIIESVVIICWEIWHNKKHLIWFVPLSILFIWWFFASGIYIWVFSGVGIILLCVLGVIVWKKIDKSIVVKSLVSIGLILICVAAGLYFMRTNDVLQSKQLFSIIKVRYYIDQGFFYDTNYLEYTVKPNKGIEPDVNYNIVFSNGKVVKQDVVKWSQLELDINKSIVVQEKVTQDEYAALQRFKDIKFDYYKVIPENNLLWWFMPLGYILAVVGSWWLKLRIAFNHQKRKIIEGEYRELENLAQDIN